METKQEYIIKILKDIKTNMSENMQPKGLSFSRRRELDFLYFLYCFVWI